MGKAQRQRGSQKKKGSSPSGVLKWVVIAAVLAAVVYGLSQMSSVAFDEDDIRVVNFRASPPGKSRWRSRRRTTRGARAVAASAWRNAYPPTPTARSATAISIDQRDGRAALTASD